MRLGWTFEGAERFVSLNRLTPPQFLVLGFAALIAMGSLLLSLPISSATGVPVPFIDAFFTSTSAVCVTGLVVVDTGTRYSPFGQSVILILIQMGGLGITMVTTLGALLLGKRITLRDRILIQESLNQFTLEGLVRLSRYILFVTALAESVGALLLFLRWIPDLGWGRALYFGIFHSVSAFNNAGFDLFGEYKSLVPYNQDVIVNAVIMSLIVLGGIGFTVIADLYNSRQAIRWSLHTKMALTVTGILILGGSLLIYLFEYDNPETLGELSPVGKVLAALFQSVTARTAGYNTVPIGGLHFSSLFLLILLMFIGASPASTGGGIKTTTFGVLVSRVYALVRGRQETVVYHRRLAPVSQDKAFVTIVLSGLLVVLSTMVLTLTESGASFLQLLFEAVSAFGTVGLSTGITPNLSAVGRILIALTMFTGRVGPFTVASAFAYRDIAPTAIRHPEERVIIG